MNVAETVSQLAGPRTDDEDIAYAELLAHVRGAFGPNATPLFTTNTDGLWDAFLGGLPADRRQHYTCRTCRQFVERFGGLVMIAPDSGRTRSTLGEGWDARGFFADAIDAMASHAIRQPVTGAFLCGDRLWGTPSNSSSKSLTGTWHHLCAIPHPDILYRPSDLATSAQQTMAEKLQEHHMLRRGLAEFPLDLVRQAHALLSTGALYRSEKCIGIAKWLLDLHERLAPIKNQRHRDNVVWAAVARAPAGFCHVRTTMISTLLEDLAAGKSVPEVKRAFDSKMDPLHYQRPHAAPTDGQIAAAETLVAKLRSAGSLARRYARLEEVLQHAIWTPKSTQAAMPAVGVFDHLKPKAASAAPLDVPLQIITWSKFHRTILPGAERIEYSVPSLPMPFFAFVTAEHPAASAILQWDVEGDRNPVSWYFHDRGSLAVDFGLAPATFVDVEAITPQPSSWTGSYAHHGEGAFFILRGARDRKANMAGLGLFPEIMKADYHGIRAAIEAFSRAGKIAGADTSSACGLAMQKGAIDSRERLFRVTSGGVRALYVIDRWD